MYGTSMIYDSCSSLIWQKGVCFRIRGRITERHTFSRAPRSSTSQFENVRQTWQPTVVKDDVHQNKWFAVRKALNEVNSLNELTRTPALFRLIRFLQSGNWNL